MEYLAYAVLLLTYLGLGLGYWPGYRMNRAAIALTGAAFLIVLGVLDFEQAWRALEPHTLGFLFGVMVLNAHLAYAGFFQLVLNWLVHLARSPLGLLIWLTLAPAFSRPCSSTIPSPSFLPRWCWPLPAPWVCRRCPTCWPWPGRPTWAAWPR